MTILYQVILDIFLIINQINEKLSLKELKMGISLDIKDLFQKFILKIYMEKRMDKLLSLFIKEITRDSKDFLLQINFSLKIQI